ncbi:MAG: AAA family ATPase [Candidatus Omnitrophica bacterium]|nr:AAA family ATPase [Candidatus Omnitrophota bacterium]
MIAWLSAEVLRPPRDPSMFTFGTTEELGTLDGIVGQQRAVSALHFGLGIPNDGFNIYVAGPPGIGKMTAVRSFLKARARQQLRPPDWCYVNNFGDPYQPVAIKLPAGRGHVLQRDMKDLMEHISTQIPKIFESEDYTGRREEITKALDRQRAELLDGLTKRAEKLGFELHETPVGIITIPLRNGRRMKEEELEALPEAAQEELERKRKMVNADLKVMMKQVRQLEREAKEKLQAIDQKLALCVVGGLIDDLIEQYPELPDVMAYLKAAQEDILKNLDVFKPGTVAEEVASVKGLRAIAPWLQERPLKKYDVNVLVDHGDVKGAPVEVELNPTFNNLFGRVEKESQLGALYTDFTMIKAGALHRANGGYLVLQVEDVLRNLFSWEGLKLALRSRQIEIEELAERLGILVSKSLRPQPIPLTVKVVLVGPLLLYHLLHAHDEKFSELFKVKADFDTAVPRNPTSVREFLTFFATFCRKQPCKPLDASAAAMLLEHASRLCEDQQKLSTHFGALTDVLHEAAFWAEQEKALVISERHVRKALDEKVYRSNLIQEKIREWIARGALLIDTEGAAIGQVNGVSIIDVGDYLFGRPHRITASVWPGSEGVVDIEREVKLSGPIHSKGVMILSGFLGQTYLRQQPLSIAARLVFEQSYEGVEGDSASCAELYALLSSLAQMPIKQGIAVTGSVNQHGQVQAVGGVNQKIEGFFDVCRAKGLTGEQGVVIPQGNVQHLVLREDVIEAVACGKFHLWAITTIDEGLEVLTGQVAGVRGLDGRFPDGTMNARIESCLKEYSESLRAYHGDGRERARGLRSSDVACTVRGPGER